MKSNKSFRKLEECFLVSILMFSILYAGNGSEKTVSQKVEGEVHANWHIDLIEDAEPLSQFELTRAYFGYKMTVNEKFTGRVMLDVGRINSVDESGKSDPRLVAYLKYGYLEMKNLIPITTIILGLHGLNQFKYQEGFWGYRYIYKSFMDQYKFGSSADLGLGIKVKPVDQLAFKIHVINGEGYKKLQGDDGKYKAAFGSEIHVVEGLRMYLYGDIMSFDEDIEKRPQGSAAVFIGYKLKKNFRIGAEYNFQANHGGDVSADYNGISGYTTVAIKKVEIFVRGDVLSKDKFETTSGTLIIGLQYAPVKNLMLAPNFQLNFPADGSKDTEPVIYINGRFKF